MAPAPEQITSMDCGWMSGDATDTPMEATNHASTQRRRRRGFDDWTWRAIMSRAGGAA